VFQESGPTSFFSSFNDYSADAIPLDRQVADVYDNWPGRVDWIAPCRTSWLKLSFSTADDTEISNFSATAEDVINNVERVKPAHVKIVNYHFDGPRVVGGGWSTSVKAENIAVGGGWTVKVEGEKRSVGGGWSVAVVATPVT